MTRLERDTRKAIMAWCKKQRINVKSIKHVHPRAYVVGKSAQRCLVVARCPLDSDPLVRQFDEANGLATAHQFEASLRVGEWAAMAYVVHDGGGERVAVRAVP